MNGFQLAFTSLWNINQLILLFVISPSKIDKMA